MSSAMIRNLSHTIAPVYHLDRNGRDWHLANGVSLRAPDRHSFGFSLDNQDIPPLAFFSRNPPLHINKMCDAIIALWNGGKLYFVVVEQKTANKNDYDKQLANGKLFCEWLVALFVHHGYCHSQSVEYVGLLVWEPRPSPRREATAHQPVVPSMHPLFQRHFEARNQTSIPLQGLIG